MIQILSVPAFLLYADSSLRMRAYIGNFSNKLPRLLSAENMPGHTCTPAHLPIILWAFFSYLAVSLLVTSSWLNRRDSRNGWSSKQTSKQKCKTAFFINDGDLLLARAVLFLQSHLRELGVNWPLPIYELAVHCWGRVCGVSLST